MNYLTPNKFCCLVLTSSVDIEAYLLFAENIKNPAYATLYKLRANNSFIVSIVGNKRRMGVVYSFQNPFIFWKFMFSIVFLEPVIILWPELKSKITKEW